MTLPGTFIDNLTNFYAAILDERAIPLPVQRLVLSMILLVCLAIRLWTIQAPALDRTDWKEIDFIEISTNYWKHGYHFLEPEITWPAEPPRGTTMELPLVPYVASLLYPVFGFNVYSVRAITLLAFLVVIVYVFKLTKRELGPLVGLLAAFASSVMPLYHPFNRYLFSDPVMIAMSVMTLFHFAEWMDFHRRRDWVLALLGFTLAVSLKVYPLYLLLPLLWIVFRKHKWRVAGYRSLGALVLCSLVLPLAWFSYIYYLYVRHMSIDTFYIFEGTKSNMFFWLSGSTWYSTMYDRIFWGILGGKVGFLLCLVGFTAAAWFRKAGLFFYYLLAIGVFYALTAQAQIGTFYAQLAIIPPLSIFIALGATSVLVTTVVLCDSFRKNAHFLRWGAVGCLIGGTVLIAMIGIRKGGQILDADSSRPVHHDTWKLAQEIKKHAGPGDRLVVLGEYAIYPSHYEVSPVLYYDSGLQGWTLPLQPGEWNLQRIQGLILRGATRFAAINMSREPQSLPFLNEMKAHYKILYEGKDQLLLDLRQPAQKTSMAPSFPLTGERGVGEIL